MYLHRSVHPIRSTLPRSSTYLSSSSVCGSSFISLSSSSSSFVGRTIVPRSSSSSSLSLSFQRHTMSTHTTPTHQPAVLVVGGNGALGENVLSAYRSAGWKTYSVGFHPNQHVDVSITFPEHANLEQQLQTIQSTLSSTSSSTTVPSFATIVCTAGGWTGGTIANEDFIKGYQSMQRMCMDSALVSAKLSTTYLASSGLLILVGSAAGLLPQPSMLAYGMSKNSTHYLTQSLGNSNNQETGLPIGSRVVCVLPRVIDTPNNRKYMGGPNVDTSSWTPIDHFSERFVTWSTAMLTKDDTTISKVPASGSLLVANTTKGQTIFEEVITESKPTGKLY